MISEEQFAELKAMLDKDAGKVHSDNGRVAASLRRILDRYREMIEDGRID